MTRRPDEQCEVVVVGSGFGGSVAAFRMAEAGRSTIVLERGKAYPPGSFARNPYEMSRAFWEPKDHLFGLFDVRSFRKIEAIVSAGLGGGSLIYANVLLRKDEHWFVHDSPLPGGGYEHWPVTRADLDPHYDAVERMLSPTPSPYPDLPKSRALREAAQAIGLESFPPPLAVTFAPPGGAPAPKQIIPEPSYGNIHGTTRLTCRLCGECDIGCNEGSKNTMDHTYLSAARHHGADIRPLCEVTSVAPVDGGGFEVSYVQYGDEADELGRRSQTVRRILCAQVFLGAGSLGTTALLLRNRVNLPGLGRALGTRFSGNGDLMTFAMGARAEQPSGSMRLIDGSYGPVITTAIRVPDALDESGGGRGYYIEEAGFPEFANWLIETSQVTSSLTRSVAVAREVLRHRFGKDFESTISGEIARLIGEGRMGSSALPLLGMGRDVADGRIVLRDGQLDVDWTSETSTAYFSAMRATMQRLTEALHARYVDNPLWRLKRVITVHPVGGVPMGRHIQEGVVDEFGEVFAYPGLFVVDGAAMPGPVGTNPALTIAAFADRAAQRVLERPAPAVAKHAAAAAAPDPATAPSAEGPGVQFTEQMKGYLALGETDPIEGWRRARQLGHRFMFELTIEAPDVDRRLEAAGRPGTARGFVRCEQLGGTLPVERGWFELFAPGEDAGELEMRYRLWLRDIVGAPVTLAGVKHVKDDPGLDVWRDTSTLYITLFAGHLAPGVDGDVRGAGVLRILPLDFARQMTTFRTAGGGTLGSLGSFGRFFMTSLRRVYLAPATPPEAKAAGRD
ncbi:GMC oxidoreductase [Demequina sp.]|uniref:GMC oxidoreductase n=1 Tax=Demequina sp. TaxID=2050685 RepID=UPI0025FD4859|nr:GMC oxidoreductase [Demequina sp.]